MPDTSRSCLHDSGRNKALIYALAYMAVAAAWVILSGILFPFSTSEPNIDKAGMLKDLLFVLATSGFIYVLLLSRHDAKQPTLSNPCQEDKRRRKETGIREIEDRFHVIAYEAPFPMQTHAEDGEILQVNRAWTEITGYTLADIPTIQIWTEKACCQNTPQAEKAIAALFGASSEKHAGELAICCKDGTERILNFSFLPLGKLADGREAVVSMATDVTARRKADERLRFAAAVFDSSYNSIVITDPDANIVGANPAFSKFTGYEISELIGKTPRLLKSGRHNADFYHSFWKTLRQNGHWQGEMWNKRKDGKEYLQWLSVSAVRGPDGETTHYIGISDDITKSRENISTINFLAYFDALTGLANRTMAMNRLEKEMAHAQYQGSRLAILHLDLDDFKTINESLGHGAGDTMLKTVAQRLLSCVRANGMVSRQGGDEFFIILPDIADLDAVNSLAVEVLSQLGKPFHIEGTEFSLSGSIGIALYPDDGTDSDSLQKKAEMAMYNAKQSGRNTHRFFTEEMNAYATEHLFIRNGLLHALEKGEFLLYYQPQICIDSGRMIGAEALLRWNHPEIGIIQPTRFIHIAEESGLIVPIGNWVLHEACKQAMAWHESGWPDLTVAVNISALQFRRGDLELTVNAALAASGLDSKFLELELTESVLIQNTEKSLDTIQRLKELGLKLSIDDFGTGFSSLSYLKHLPVDKLKIDRSFVSDITENHEDAAIVLSIISLAHTLKKTVVAEGVETKAQLEFLRRHHCDEMQGFFFSHPLPADDFLRLLQEEHDLKTSEPVEQ